MRYALLTAQFFRHNEHISASIEHRSEAPISAYSKYSTEGEIEVFGLSALARRDSPEPDLQAPVSKVKMTNLGYKEVQQVLSSLEVEDQALQDNTNLEFTSEEALCILKQAVSAFYVSITLQKTSKTADFSSKNIFTTFMAMLEGCAIVNRVRLTAAKLTVC